MFFEFWEREEELLRTIVIGSKAKDNCHWVKSWRQLLLLLVDWLIFVAEEESFRVSALFCCPMWFISSHFYISPHLMTFLPTSLSISKSNSSWPCHCLTLPKLDSVSSSHVRLLNKAFKTNSKMPLFWGFLWAFVYELGFGLQACWTWPNYHLIANSYMIYFMTKNNDYGSMKRKNNYDSITKIIMV